MTKSTITFDNALAAFVKSTTKSMEYARICAEMAIRHAHQHGDLVYCQRFLDAFPRNAKGKSNYIRRVAFLRWLSAHAPVLVEGDLLKLDKSDDKVAWNLDAACAEPFWEYAPDTEQFTYVVDDVVTALQRACKKFHNSEKYAPKTPEQAAHLAEIEQAIGALAKRFKGQAVASTTAAPVEQDNDDNTAAEAVGGNEMPEAAEAA